MRDLARLFPNILAAACVSALAMDARADDILLPSLLDPEILSILQEHRALISESVHETGPSGSAVALVFDNELVWAEGFGTTQRGNQRPVDAETLFSVQSVSKTYTATAVMKAVQEKRVSLGRSITRYLPDFRVRSRFSERPERDLSLRLLLSHYAGFPHEAPIGNNFKIEDASFSEHIQSLGDVWLRHPVGERYAYSNLGIDLAGHILVVRYGMPFERVMERLVFEPLALDRTTADPEEILADQNRAVGQSEKHESIPVTIPMIPSGGVYASVRDMATFMQFHLKEGMLGEQRVIDKDVLRRMYTTQIEETGAGETYRLGVSWSEMSYGGTVVNILGHSGSGFGFSSAMYWVPGQGLALAIVANSDTNANVSRIHTSLMKRILSQKLGEQSLVGDNLDSALSTKTLDEDRIGRIEGTYTGSSQQIELVRKDGILGWQFRNSFSPLEFVDESRFSASTGSMTLSCLLRADDLRDPAWMDCAIQVGDLLRFSDSMHYDHGPSDPPGPNKPEWQRYLGDYELLQWGTPIATETVSIERGYLRFAGMRVVEEYEPGIFFLSNGEVLDLRNPSPHWSNRPLRKKTTN